MGGNYTGMIMATKRKQPRKRGGNKTRAPETAPPSGLGGGWEKMASGYPAREPADAGRPNLQQIPLPKNYSPLVETFIGALGAAFATRAFRHLTEPRRLVVFVGHIGMHSGAPVLHVTDELERTEDGTGHLARPSCNPEHVSPAMKAWPVTQLKETHDALADGAHWCHRCEELAKVQIAEFATRRAESFAAGGGIIGSTVKHEPPAEAPIGPERAQKLMDDLNATSPDTTDRRVSHDCDDCSFVGTRNGEPACNLDDRVLPMDAGPAPDWCRLRQGPVLVTLKEKP